MLVVARIGIETVLAFFCSLHVPVSGLNLLLSAGTVSTAYLAGYALGLALELVLCIVLIRDVVGLVWRLRPAPRVMGTRSR